MIGRAVMRRSRGQRAHNAKGEFALFDMVYEDGSRRSNLRAPVALLGSLEKDAPALGFIIEQDRDISEKSNRALLQIKRISRVGTKPEIK